MRQTQTSKQKSTVRDIHGQFRGRSIATCTVAGTRPIVAGRSALSQWVRNNGCGAGARDIYPYSLQLKTISKNVLAMTQSAALLLHTPATESRQVKSSRGAVKSSGTLIFPSHPPNLAVVFGGATETSNDTLCLQITWRKNKLIAVVRSKPSLERK